MLTFNEWKNYDMMLEAETVFKHSTHIEDLIFTNGRKGLSRALGGLLHVRKVIGKSNGTIQRKVDGAPALIFGSLNDKFFVATKSLFNKDPKINFSHEDIDDNHSGELAQKLHLAYDLLQDVVPKGIIIQGDFLFDSSTRKEETIDSIDYYTFHPNTIKYAVYKDSSLGKKIGAAKFGIVFHTEYTSDGSDPKSIRLKGFNVSEDMFNKSKDVWFTDTSHKDVSKLAAFDNETSKNITELVNRAKSLINIDDRMIETVSSELLSFVNTYIRNNQAMPNPTQRANEFISYIQSKYQKELDSKKTEKAKEKVRMNYEPKLSSLKIDKLTKIFELHSILTELKHIMISKLETIKSMKTFLQKTDGSLEVTGSEGYVLVNTSASGCKLVSRYDFSKANFSKDFVKGWEHR